MKIGNFRVMDTHGDRIAADAHGNNVAFCCFACGHRVVAVALENQRRSDEEHPAVCNGCNARYFLDVRQAAENLYIHVDALPTGLPFQS
ncbi:hypothetical protein [Xanthomonas oryzae]|nr:hypothetical protein [Xanthomonas oryzae]